MAMKMMNFAPGGAQFGAMKDLAKNMSKNKDPMFAMNPFQRGSVANMMDSFTPHGMIMRQLGIGKGGEGGSAYATGKFDPQSENARSYLSDYLKRDVVSQQEEAQKQIARGIQNREQTRLAENQRLLGPQLRATEVRGVPEFLKRAGDQSLFSGANRGTGYGRALESAIGRGESEVPYQENKLGAKGTPTGLAKENIPTFAPKMADVLTPAELLHAQTSQMVQGMNKPKAK